jgi:hypothetical protein
MTTTRYCTACAADVEVGGPARPSEHRAPVQSIAELRAEVDRASDLAMAEIAAHTGRSERTSSGRPAAPPPPPPAPRPHEAPAPPRSTPEPLPPAALTGPAPDHPRTTVWSALEERADYEGEEDPIVAFAPAPRMDWGPDRPVINEVRNLLRRPSGASA